MASFLDLFKKKDIQKEFSCINLESCLFFDAYNNIRICPKENFGIITSEFNGLGTDTNMINKERADFLDIQKNISLNSLCKNCEYLMTGKGESSKEIKTLYLGQWHNCYQSCLYCDRTKTSDLIKAAHYDISPVLMQLIDAKMLTFDTKTVFECGDAPLHPEFDKLLLFLINFGLKNIEIHTPCLTYRDSVAEGIAKNKVNLVVNMDCGNANVYEYIKKNRNQETVLENIKRYMQFQEPGEKRIALKFTLIKGANDDKKEIADWLVLAQDYGIKKLYFDIEENFYKEISESMPWYVTEILCFLRQAADISDFVCSFYPRAELLYSKIDNPQKVRVF